MKVIIVGAGAVGQAYVALLATRGHEPVILQPRSSRFGSDATKAEIKVIGLVEAQIEVPVTKSYAAIASAEIVIICTLSNGFRSVVEQIVPHLAAHHTVIVSSHSSLCGLYLSKLSARRGIRPLIVCWATTVSTGTVVDNVVTLRVIRKEIDVATIPAARSADGVTISTALFGSRFVPSDNLLAISLSRPSTHLASALLNFTRIELGETWQPYNCITEGVARLLETLDEERLTIARSFGLTVRSIRDHYYKSFPGLDPDSSLAEMTRTLADQRKGSAPGPRNAGTRWVTEDMPFAVYTITALGEVAGIATPTHDAGFVLYNAIYGKDFKKDNDLLAQIDLGAGLRTVIRRSTQGWEGQSSNVV